MGKKYLQIILIFMLLQIYVFLSIASIVVLKYVDLSIFYICGFPFLFWALILIHLIKWMKNRAVGSSSKKNGSNLELSL